jgi:hypothetical protein
MGRECSRNDREEACIRVSQWESQREGDYWEDIDVSGKMILKWSIEK